MKKSTNALLNAPYALWSAIFVVVPLFIVIVYAFTDAEGHFSFDSILALKDYGHNFLISLLYSLVATVITLIIAYPFAYALSKTNEKTQRIQMMLVMLPMWMNLLIRTYSWMNILDQNGIINQLLMTLGLKPATFLGTPGAVIFGMVYNYLPYMILPIYTVMAKMDNSLVEAARDLGCNGGQVLRRVILPLSIPGILNGVTMVLIPSISTFYISQKLGNGRFFLIGDAIEGQYVANNLHFAAAMAFILMIILLAAMALIKYLTGHGRYGEGAKA